MTASKIVVSKNSLQEETLLLKLAQGDRDVFWPLWNIHRDYLYTRCRVWMGGNHFDAEEAISLTVLKAWKKLPEHASKITNLKGWLNRLTHNLCVDLHRQRQRHAISTENIDEKQDDFQGIENPSVSNPEAILLQKEFNVYLRYCIEKLPSRLRNPLVLKYYQDMSYAEIGTQLSITQNNVSKYLKEAKDLLREFLGQYSSGVNSIMIDEATSQELEWKNFQAPLKINAKIEEISYIVTISCLETLPPVWCNSLQMTNWI